MTRADRALWGAVLGALTATAVAMILVGVRGEIANANVALALVLPIVAAAAIGGWPAGTVTAIAAAISFDYFHTRPYYSLKIRSADDIETTLLLLVLGLAIGQLASWAMESRRNRKRHIAQLSRLAHIARLASRGETADDVASGIASELVSELKLRDCWFERRPFLAGLPRIQPNGTVEQRLFRLARHGFELPRDGVEIPVTVRGDLVGRFVLLPNPGIGTATEERLLALVLAGQLSLLLDHGAA
jgi:hypothetical protein